MKSITKNHYILFIFFLPLILLILACEGPKIFETPTALSTDDNIIGPVGTELITVHISDGNTGLDQQLHIWQNGYTHIEGFQGAKLRTLSLKPNQVDELIQLFVANDFMHLENQYLSKEPSVINVIIYDINFNYGGVSNHVLSDNKAGPTSLNKIVAGLNDLIYTELQNMPRIELILDQTQLTPGSTLNIQLKVSNPLNKSLDLMFPTSQVYDFYIKEYSQSNNNPQIVWYWSYDKVFAQAVKNVVLEPGETRIYEAQWDGRDMSGNIREGTFLVSAELKSTPGVVSDDIKITVFYPHLVTKSVVTYGDTLQVAISVHDSVFIVGDTIEVTTVVKQMQSKNIPFFETEQADHIEFLFADTNLPVWSQTLSGSDFGENGKDVTSQYEQVWNWNTAERTWGMSGFMTGEYLIKGVILGKLTGELRILIKE